MKHKMTVQLDLSTLNAAFDGDTLTIEVPCITLPELIVSTRNQEALIDCGLTAQEVENAIDNFMGNLQAKLVAGLLANRIIRGWKYN